MKEERIKLFLNELLLSTYHKNKYSVIIGAYIGNNQEIFSLIQKNAENIFSAFKIVTRSSTELSFELDNAIIIITSEKTQSELMKYLYDELVIISD